MKLSVDGVFDDEAWMPYASTHELFYLRAGLHQAAVVFVMPPVHLTRSDR